MSCLLHVHLRFHRHCSAMQYYACYTAILPVAASVAGLLPARQYYILRRRLGEVNQHYILGKAASEVV